MEQWKQLNQTYSVSDEGRIRNHKTGRILKQANSFGYRICNLNLDGKTKTYRVHRLVLKAFKPIDNPDLFQVHHIDSNKENNRLENLEWVTGLENRAKTYIDDKIITEITKSVRQILNKYKIDYDN